MPVVEVEWEDTMSFREGGWMKAETIAEWAEKPAIVRSVGYLFRKTKRRIVLVQSEDTDPQDGHLHDNLDGAVKIPTGFVRRIRTLRRGSK